MQTFSIRSKRSFSPSPVSYKRGYYFGNQGLSYIFVSHMRATTGVGNPVKNSVWKTHASIFLSAFFFDLRPFCGAS